MLDSIAAGLGTGRISKIRDQSSDYSSGLHLMMSLLNLSMVIVTILFWMSKRNQNQPNIKLSGER